MRVSRAGTKKRYCFGAITVAQIMGFQEAFTEEADFRTLPVGRGQMTNALSTKLKRVLDCSAQSQRCLNCEL